MVGSVVTVGGMSALFIDKVAIGYPPPAYENLLVETRNGTFSHWTVTRRPTTLREAIDSCRGIDLMHRAPPRNWSQIAYSLLYTSISGIGPVILEGRGVGVQGGHTRGYNSSSHALSRLAGAFYPSYEPMDDDERRAFLIGLEIIRRGGFQSHPVRPHHSVASTACGGPANTAWIDQGMPAPGPTAPPMPPPPEPEESDVRDLLYFRVTDGPNAGTEWVQTPTGNKALGPHAMGALRNHPDEPIAKVPMEVDDLAFVELQNAFGWVVDPKTRK